MPSSGSFPIDVPATPRHKPSGTRLRQERSRAITDRTKAWALAQVGLPRSELGKAVRYMLERWTGLTPLLDNPCIPLDNNAASFEYAASTDGLATLSGIVTVRRKRTRHNHSASKNAKSGSDAR